MSGPKGIIIEDPAELERRRNESQIALLRSEYLSAVRSLNFETERKTKYTGEVSESNFTSESKIFLEIDRLLCTDYIGTRALKFLEAKCYEINLEIQSIRKQNLATTEQAQQKFRELIGYNQDFETARSHIIDFSKLLADDDWPDAIKLKVTVMKDELSAMSCPSATDDLVLEHRALEELSNAHSIAGSAMSKLEQVCIALSDLIDKAHVQHVKERLRDNLPNVKSVGDSLVEHRSLQRKPKVLTKLDLTICKLDKLMSKVLLLNALPDYQLMQDRVQKIREEVDLSRRRMLYDDLLITCDQKIKHLQKVESWRGEMDKLLELVDSITLTEARNFRSELENLQRAGSPVSLEPYQKRALSLLEKQQELTYREERRVAVLGALESMGYKVQDGMQTGKVIGGRLVFQKNPDSEYALEVLSSEGKEIIQTRIIRFGDESSCSSEFQKRKDIEVEESWCEDHAELLANLRKEGYQVAFRLKRKPGELDVKVVSPPLWWEQRQKKLKEKKRIMEAPDRKSEIRKP